MPLWENPFKKHDVSDFHGVFKPLADAPRHGTTLSARDVGYASVDDKQSYVKNVEAGSASSVDQYSGQTLEALRAEIDADMASRAMIPSTIVRKSKIINRAIQDIGMGSYQWQLFILCGFGWLADNLWLQGVALTLPQLSLEFGISSTQVRYTTCATFVGLCLGASIWGVASDVLGRRIAFNATLFLAGVFGLAIGGGDSWIAVCALFACMGVGVGGNLPVDGSLFLEFLPTASGSLLTMLSVWWPVGQVIASLIAWAFIPNYSCAETLPSCLNSPAPCCSREDNMGWRYFVLTLGALTFAMFVCRFFCFHLYESPKYLLSQGRQAEAVATVHGIAYKNQTTTWLSEEVLNEIGGNSMLANPQKEKLSTGEIVRRTLGKFSGDRVAPLFATKKIGAMTILIWLCWATIGMGYPLFNAFLPQYLSNAGKGLAPTPTNIVYRNYVITSIVGVPGSVLACYTVDLRYIGRKGTIAISTLITGIILFCFTISNDPNIQVTLSSLEGFFQNIMYGVLYAYTPEVFPAPNRGTGTGIASLFNRIAGLLAPIVAIYAGGANPSAPIFASGALILCAFIAMCFFPIETRGKQML